MPKRTLASIQRDLEIVLESFQAIESLAHQANYEGASQDVSKAMVPTNLLMEDLIEQIRNASSATSPMNETSPATSISTFEKVSGLKLRTISQPEVRHDYEPQKA